MPGTITFRPIEANLTHNTDILTKMNPYCSFILGTQKYNSDICKKGGKHPVWNDAITVQTTNESVAILEIMDKDRLTKDDIIGGCSINLSDLQASGSSRNWYPLFYKNKPAGEILLETSYSGSGLIGQQNMGMGMQSGVIGNEALLLEQQKLSQHTGIIGGYKHWYGMSEQQWGGLNEQDRLLRQREWTGLSQQDRLLREQQFAQQFAGQQTIIPEQRGHIFTEQHQTVEPHTFMKNVEVVETVPVQKTIEVMESRKVLKNVEYTEAVPVHKQIDVVEPVVVMKEVEVIEPRVVRKTIEVIENVPVTRQVEVVEMVHKTKNVETFEPQTFTKQVEVTEQFPVTKTVTVSEPVTVTKSVEFVEPVITTQTITKEIRPEIIVGQTTHTEVGPATLLGFTQHTGIISGYKHWYGMSEQQWGGLNEQDRLLRQREWTGLSQQDRLLREQQFAQQFAGQQTVHKEIRTDKQFL